MPKIRTYIDTNVLIAAFRGDARGSAAAMRVLDNPQREFVASAFLKLETLRKPRYLHNQDEVAFYETFFASSDHVSASDSQVTQALELASCHDLGAMDALHAAAALEAEVDEFITLEQTSKPLFRVTGMRMVSLYQDAGP